MTFLLSTILAVLGGLLAAAVPPASAASSAPEAAAVDDLTTDGAESSRAAGAKVQDLKGGVCAVSVPEGLVRLSGPGGVRLVARVRRSGDARLLTIVSGSGRIGGVVVRPKDVSGELTWRPGKGSSAGSMTGSVTIGLADHAKVSRTWAQQVEVTGTPSGCDWSGAVHLAAKGVGANLDLRGPLAKDGSYQLRGSGVVSINRTRVPVTGVLRASNTSKATWRITGQTSREVRIGGARLSGITVALTEAVSLPLGAAVLGLDEPRLSANARLEISGADTWRASVTSSNRRSWILPQTDMAVQTGKLSGSLGMRQGQAQWNLSAPGAVRIGRIDYITEVGFAGPLTYTVQAKAAVGQFLGLPQSRPFIGVPTKLTVTPKGITGALTVATRGNLLLDLTGEWHTATDYILTPVAGQGWSFKPFISHAIRAGKGTIRLSGPVAADGSVSLIGSGTMDISGTRVPVRGYYKRTGFANGSTPVWALAAYPSEAPGGRIPLEGGAGFVGGTLVFRGTGSQPVNTIPDATPTPKAASRAATHAQGRAASPAAAPIVSGGQTLTTVAYDGFSYPPVDLDGLNGGSGWLGSWSMANKAGGSDKIQASGMSFSGLDVTGGSVLSGKGGNGINGYGRTLPRMDSGVVYLQFLSNFGTQTGGGAPNLRLLDSSSGALQGGVGNNGGPNMSILDSGLNPAATSATSMNGNVFTIVRIDHDTNVTSMWVNPDMATFDYANPPTPNAQKSGMAPTFDRLEAYTRNGQVFDEIMVMTLNPAPPPAPVTVTGTTTVQLSDANDDTFYLPVTYSYTDPNNWTATVAGTTPSNLYGPFIGLEIPESDFSGTITDEDGEQTWDVAIAMQDWVNIAEGIDYHGAFTISNTCQLPNPDDCPDAEGIFIGGQSELDFDGNDVPNAYAVGGFLTDLSWAYWQATVPGSVTFNNITMSNPDLTVWRGSSVNDHPNLILPDLSELNGNAMNVEFCANFTVDVPDVETLNTLGCAEWSSEGVVIGQVATGGDVPTEDYNGVEVNSTSLTGYAWNGLEEAQSIFLNGVEIEAEPDRNYLTGDIVVPGNAMHDFGSGTDSDTVITAQGWFDFEGNFALDGSIPVDLSGSGFTLKEILISISKMSEEGQTDFSLRFDAECDVVVNGNHFPLDVYIGYEHAGDSTITVGLSATGTRSTQPDGTMDFVNLLPSGDFEPENAVLVDGSFDGRLPDNNLDDGGFERSKDPGNLVANGDFETDIADNVLPGGDFENGLSGNLLANGDFEDQNFLINPGFDDNAGSYMGWWPNSKEITVYYAAGTATGPQEEGTTVAAINNNGGGNGTGGLAQDLPNQLTGYTVTVSAWVRTNNGKDAPFHVAMRSTDCSKPIDYRGATVTAPAKGTWVQASVTATIGDQCPVLSVILAPEAAGSSVLVDAVDLSIPQVNKAMAYSVASVVRPNIVATFDSLSTTPLMPGYTDGVSIATDYPGTLATNGYQAWMLYDANAGYSYGDFDVSYKVMFPPGGSREIADFGFWLDGNYNTMNGYCFRIQTSGGDGGFFNCSRTSKVHLTGSPNVPNATPGHWYQVRLTAVSGRVTASVADLTTGAGPQSITTQMPTSSSGVFGQVADGVSSSTGIRWDDIQINSLQGTLSWDSQTEAPARVWLGGGGGHTGIGYASLYTTKWTGVPFEQSTNVAPEHDTTYTYSAWLRAASGTVSGTLSLGATGGAYTESVGAPFTVGTSWTKVVTTLPVSRGDQTDLRPRITINTANAELQVDDQVLQQVPMRPWGNSSTVEVTSEEAHSGLNSLAIQPFAGGSTLWDTNTAAQPGSVVTVTAWVMSPDGVDATMRLQEQSSSTVSFHADDTWRQITTTHAMQGNVDEVQLAFDYGPNPGKRIYVDDVQMTVTQIASDSPDLGAPPAPSGWTATEGSGGATPVVVNSAELSHGGLGALRVMPFSNSTATSSYVTATTPTVGSTWNLLFWVQPGGGAKTLTATFSAGSNNVVTQNVALSDGRWTQVTMPLRVAKSANAPLSVSLSTNGQYQAAYIDDLAITEEGLDPVDSWQVYSPGGFLSVQGIKDPTSAHSGDGYLTLGNTGTQTASIYLDPRNYKPRSGNTHELSLWVKSPSGNVGGVMGWLRTQDANGNTLDSNQIYFTATPTWQNVLLSVPIVNSNAVNLRTEIKIPAGATLWLDDMESRDINDWSAVQPTGGVTSIAVIDNAPDAVDGQNFLRVLPSAGGGGMGDTITVDVNGKAIAVAPGASYRLNAYVRSSAGVPVTGTMSLATTTNGNQADKASVSFTAGSDWTPIELTLQATKSANALIPKIVLSGPGAFDVDALALTPLVIEQADPWAASGGGVTWQVIDDPAHALDSSYGVMQFEAASAGTGIKHGITHATSPGDVYSLTAFVRSGSGTPIAGEVVVTTVGGDKESWSASFSGSSSWQPINVPISVTKSGHSGFEVQVLAETTGALLYVDNVAMVTNPWTGTNGALQSVVFSGMSAQSGSGYLLLTPRNSSGGAYLDMPASDDLGGEYPAGSSWTVTAHIRSVSPSSIASGSISLGVPGGDTATSEFAVGSDWSEISIDYTPGTNLDDLRVSITVNGSSVPLALDSVTIAETGDAEADGVTEPLPHPETGWVYLWNDAFGVPGMHLWAVSAQVEFEAGVPGLGVSATTYQDPTAMPNVMTGTDWIKGDMALNISEADPCFLFDFSANGGDSGVSLSGVFTTKDFSINFAPRGCEVGPYVLPKGASLSFDGELGDGALHFDLAITEGDDGPEFSESIGITDIVIGGTDFKEAELDILLTETEKDITFSGNMTLPMGNFEGHYDLTANEEALNMDGSVSLTDWQLVGGGFDVEEFNFDMSMTVPFGNGQCGSFAEDASGQMDMGSKVNLNFDGNLEVDCGKLKVLHMRYDYHHGAVTEDFNLDYDSATGILAGGVQFAFERGTSWRHFFHHYSRHPYFTIKLDYSMNVKSPSTAKAHLYGEVDVSGGDGSVECTLYGGSSANWADDQCSLHVHINAGGGHTYDASW